LLERAGLQPGVDVNLNYSFPSHVELANVVRAERAELGVLSEPMASMVLDQNPNLVQALDLQAAWDSLHHHQVSLPQTAVMIRDEFAAQNPELVAHLEESLRSSIDWVRNHPAEAGQLVARFGILPDARVAAASIPRCNFGFQTAMEVKPDLQSFYALMAGLNPDSIGGSLPDDEFYYKR
jgi:NitT/TauT family transport system substrate-binding protein